MMIIFEEVETNLGFYLHRAQTPSGWLVVITVDQVGDGSTGGSHFRCAPTFVPDPDHSWTTSL
jgi:hypothetical protein